MELLPLLFMSSCFLTLSGLTVGDQSGKSVTKVTVKEDAEAILPCSLGTNENIESKMFVWKKEGTDHVFLYNPDSNPPSNPGDQFKGRVSHFPGELEHGNASIKIIKTRVEDKGTYSCFLLDSETKFYVELAVGVAQPFVIIPDRTNDWALLRCDVKNAYPKPTVEWRNSNNEIIHSEEPQVSEVGGRFYITVETNVTKDDRYLCVAKQENISHQAHTEISVELNGKPVIVKEGDYAILPCSLGTNENIEFMRFEWKKEGTEEEVYIYDNGVGYSPALPGRVSHFRDDLKHGNASIRINNVQLEDKGNYTCNFPNRGKTFRIKLVVEPILKVRNVSGAAELYVTSHDQINGGVLLQCDVKNAHPKPTVEWQDSNNEIIPSEEPQVSKQGDRFYITLKATVKKSGRYRCVAKQEEINHQAQKEIYVYIYGKPVIVKEGDDAILPCSLDTNIEFVMFEWTKEGTEKKVFTYNTGVNYSPALPGRVSYFQNDLKNGNASIRVNNVQLEDKGIYTCNFPSRGKTFRIELVVGAAEPEITSHDKGNGGVLLQCDVKNARPKPTVEWWDSNNEIIPSEEPQVSTQGDRFNITLKATVKKSGRYRCVAKQEEINHQAQKEIHVYIYEKSDSATQGFPVWAAILIGVLVVVIVVGVVLKVKGYCLKKGRPPHRESFHL